MNFVYNLFLTLAVAWGQGKTPTIVALGDSLTEGYGVSKTKSYPTLVEEKIRASGKNWKVQNAGVSGSTSASAISRMRWHLKARPEIILLALGANDGLRGLPVTETEKNLSQAIDLAKKEKVKVVLAGILLPPNYGKEYTTGFEKMYQRLAQKHDVTFIPFLLKDVGGKSELNLADGIHPNEKGHVIIAETVYQAIKGLL